MAVFTSFYSFADTVFATFFATDKYRWFFVNDDDITYVCIIYSTPQEN